MSAAASSNLLWQDILHEITLNHDSRFDPHCSFMIVPLVTVSCSILSFGSWKGGLGEGEGVRVTGCFWSELGAEKFRMERCVVYRILEALRYLPTGELEDSREGFTIFLATLPVVAEQS